MDEGRPLQWKVGVRVFWILERAAQLFFVVAFLKTAYQDYSERSFLAAALNVAVILGICAFFHRFASGWIDSEGIHYRRYFREKTIPWSKIREAQWRGNRLTFLLKESFFLDRRLDFSLNPFTSAMPYARHRAGIDTFLPPILERVNALGGGNFEIVSAPTSSRWLFRLTFWLGLLLLAVFLFRLLSALTK